MLCTKANSTNRNVHAAHQQPCCCTLHMSLRFQRQQNKMDRSKQELAHCWKDVVAYTKSRSMDDAGICATRQRLLNALQAQLGSPTAWWAFLQHEEGSMSNCTATLDSLHSRRISLLQLYHWATKLVPRSSNSNNDTYVQLWLAYARHQWYNGRGDDAIETFQTLKSNCIGMHNAHLYAEWAALELALGVCGGLKTTVPDTHIRCLLAQATAKKQHQCSPRASNKLPFPRGMLQCNVGLFYCCRYRKQSLL